MTKKNATDSETKKRERGGERERERGWQSGREKEGLVTARHFGTWQFPPRAHDKNVKFAKREGGEGGRLR